MAISVDLTKWKPWIRNVITEFNRAYPLLSWGTYAGHEPREDQATDGMVPGWQNPVGNTLGWACAKVVWANRKKYNVWYVIFDGKIISQTRPDAGWQPYFARNDPNPSKSHKNHVHVSFYSNDPGGLAAGPVLTGWDGKSFPGAQYFYIGAQGSHVTWLGERLVKHGWTGYMVGPGTEFHPNDQKGVKWFQEKQGWTGSDADGIPGPLTWSLLAAEPVVAPPVTPPVVVPPVVPPKLPTYKVKAGDTLTKIADRIGLTWQALAALNPGVNADKLNVGQVLNVPKTVPPVVKPPTSTPKPTPVPDPKPVPTVHTTNIVYGNILRRTDTEPGRKRWPARKANVVKHLKSGNPSVVLACECDKETADDIAAGLGPSWSYYPSQYGTGKTFSPLAVFWDSSVWERREDSFVKEYADNENRFLQRQPLVHKASGKTVWFYASHLENDGDPATDGHKARLRETSAWADWTLSGPGVWGADLNSTTRSSESSTTREKQKPRPILRGVGWKMLSDQTGVANREYASHHGGKGSTPKGAWIDDMGFKGVTYVDGALIRTDGTDASDHHFLSITIKL